MKNKFYTFIAPYLSVIDDGKIFQKPFSWLYSLIAIGNLLFPVYLLSQAIKYDVFKLGFKFGVKFILAWLVVVVAFWIGFQIWWDRKNKINLSISNGDDFVAIPAVAHLIQTLGEWMGTLIGFIGFVFGILSMIAFGDAGFFISYQLGFGVINAGPVSIIAAPIFGFLVIVISRFVSEQIRVLAMIANNTKETVVQE